MVEIDEANLRNEIVLFWYDIKSSLERHIKGKIEMLYDTNSHCIYIKIELINFNQNFRFSFPSIMEDKIDLINHILNEIQYEMYKLTFNN